MQALDTIGLAAGGQLITGIVVDGYGAAGGVADELAKILGGFHPCGSLGAGHGKLPCHGLEGGFGRGGLRAPGGGLGRGGGFGRGGVSWSVRRHPERVP